MQLNSAIFRGWWIVLAAALGALVSAKAESTILYSTGFELEEGYDPHYELVGQEQWIGAPGASGILSNFFPGLGQQAYLGFTAPERNTNDFFSVYRPVNIAPIPTNQSLLRFSVLMQIVDSTSTNGPWDDFRWSAYNTNGVRLFTLDFDNASLMVSYILDDGRFVATDVKFDTLGYYELAITMNFKRNLWTATLNDQIVVNAQPITTAGNALNLGDVDAVWGLRDRNNPGNNYMLFDDYTISAEMGSSIPARLETVSGALGTSFQARLYGEPGLVYRVEGSEDFKAWQTIITFTAPQGGILQFQDSTAAHNRRFYRARQAQ